MNRGSSITPWVLECMLCDETAEPKALPLSLLEEITYGFSDKQIIGRGGFAVVYKGMLENRTVAVKRMSDVYIDEKVFHREVECLMMVKHKYVVRFLGYCADRQGSMERYDGKFVMADVNQRLLCFEYLSKGSLDKYITDTSCGLRWRDRYRIITGICQGLHYLHQKNIVHLDLKPANILLDDNLVPKITDFGISRCHHEIQSRVITTIVGTFGYLAPESFNNTKVTYRHSYRLDIYSLGIVIIEILTGEKGYHDVDNVVESWSKSNMLEKSQSDIQLKQVRVCAEIGIKCIDSNPAKRPDTQHIINILNEYIETGVTTSPQIRQMRSRVLNWLFEQAEDASTSYLPIFFEEPSSSFSEAAEADPLPAIDAVRITGEAFPGREIQASGYSINGTTSCSFEWLRYLEDGSVNYIEAAEQPTYLVTADDLDSLLSVEVLPLDDRKREGKIMKVYANEQRKITFHPEMKELIKNILSIGHVSYEVQLQTVRFLDMWEPAVLEIQRKGYSIKCIGQRGVVLTESFQHATVINIPYGRPIEFSIQSADGSEYNLKPTRSSLSRDSIVGILRLFKKKAEDASTSYLPTFFDEPSSSFSEAAEADPLPAIDAVRITGEAFPGREIQASGYSINGTTSCSFEWVRHLEDGSVNYIEAAKQPTYLVTADDLDSLLSVEVMPLDDQKRKGEIVKVYANKQRKITFHPEMKELIKKILLTGHVSYEVLLPTVRFLDMWEPAVLAIQRKGYSIKCNRQRGVVLTEKFQQATIINISYGRPIEFSIRSADGAEYNLKPTGSSLSRDSIVGILRMFRKKAIEKIRERKRRTFLKLSGLDWTRGGD